MQRDRTSRRPSLLQRAFRLRSENLGQRIATGVSYQFLGIFLRTAMTIGSTAVLARLLMPADFGYLAMATIVTEFAALLGNFGLNALLIQRRTIARVQIDTVFWSSLVLGLVLAICVGVASLFVGGLFSDDRVGTLLQILCLNFVFGSLYTVPSAILARLLKFKFEFWINITTIAVRSGAAIVLAFHGWGLWALVAGSVVGSFTQAVLGLLVVPYRPRRRFQLQFVAGSWRTSMGYFGGGLLYYANANFDLMLIGRMMGATALGYYQNARSLTDEIRSRIGMPLQQVLFPAFSSLQSDRAAIQRVVLRSGRLLAAATFPIGVGVSALSAELVSLLYGPKWLAMVPIVSMFGLSAAVRASLTIATPIFNSHARVGMALRYGVIGSLLHLAAVWIAIPYGIEAVAYGVALTSLYGLFPFAAALKLVGLGVRHVLSILGPPAMASAACWGLVYMLRPSVSEVLQRPAAILLVLGVLSGCLYMFALHLISREYWCDFRQVLARMRAKA